MRKDVPLAQINGNILEAIRPVPMERIQDRAATQIVDSLVRQTTEEIAVGVQPVPAERMQERAGRADCDTCVADQGGQFVELPVPPIMEEIMGVIQPVPCERMPERIAEEITVSTVPQTTEEIVDDLQLVPQFAGAPVPRIEEQVVDVFKSSPQVRVSERIGEWETKVQEQIVEVSQVLPQQRKKRVFVDLVPPHTAPKPCFSGEMPHRRVNPCTGKFSRWICLISVSTGLAHVTLWA